MVHMLGPWAWLTFLLALGSVPVGAEALNGPVDRE